MVGECLPIDPDSSKEARLCRVGWRCYSFDEIKTS